MTDRLVAVGPHRGELRFRDAEPNSPVEPYRDAAGNRYTFLGWRVERLEGLEARFLR